MSDSRPREFPITPRPLRHRRFSPIGPILLLAGLALAVITTPTAPDHVGASAPAAEATWELQSGTANPTGAVANEGWQVSATLTSLAVTQEVFPSKAESTAESQFEAVWAAPPEQLTPGSQLDLPVTATGTVSGGRDEQFFTSLSATAIVNGVWNRDTVTVDANCVEEAGGIVCTEPTSVEDTLTYAIPASGDTFTLGVGALNCGDACDVEWTYAWSEAAPAPAPAPTAPPPATETPTPSDGGDTDAPDTPGSAATAGTTSERANSLSFLGLLTDADLDEADALAAGWVVVAEEYLGGRDSVTALLTLRQVANDFFDDKIRHAENNQLWESAELLREAQAKQGAQLDAEIEEARSRQLTEASAQLSVILQVLMEGADSIDPGDPPDLDSGAQAVVRDLHADDAAQTVVDALDGQLLDAVGNRAPDDAAPPTDPPTDVTPTVPPPANTASTGDDLDLRPLRFTNTGFVPVTVRAATYDPAPGLESVAMSRASTVVFPDANPSSYLDLPQGTYTFCYDWELGDPDGDGVANEAHAVTSSVTLDRNTPADPVLAPEMTVNPAAGGTAGACNASDPPSSIELTPSERAARDAASYNVACTYGDGTSSERITTYWFEFTDGAAGWWETGADTAVDLQRTDQDFYIISADQTLWLEFHADGFDIWGDGVGNIQNCAAVRTP